MKKKLLLYLAAAAYDNGKGKKDNYVPEEVLDYVSKRLVLKKPQPKNG